MSSLPRNVLLTFMLVVAGACGDSDPGAADAAASADAAIAPGCSAPTGPGTEHQGLIEGDETWTAADSPHLITFDSHIADGTVTIEPCAVVRLRKGVVVTIGAGEGEPAAALVAHGDSIDNPGADPTIHPITFERADANEPWGALLAYTSGTLDLEHVRLVGAGDPDTAPQQGGTLIASGPGGGGTSFVRNLRTVDVTVEGSGGFGVNVQDRAAFTDDSDRLTITGSGALPDGGSTPIFVTTSALSTIPVGVYTGNAIDEITVQGVADLRDDVTFHARGVAYHVRSQFSMAPENSEADGGLTTLTIEAGVEIRFDRDESGARAMVLGTSGGSEPADINPTRLIAQGTSDLPIVLTSNESSPVAGDWVGISWRGGPPDGNVMEWVTIAHAGGPSGSAGFGCGPTVNDAAVIIANWRPDDAFIQHSTFSDSAGGGIVSGWISDLDGPDLTADNTFTGIANGCEVSRWADTDGCPGTPPLCL